MKYLNVPLATVAVFLAAMAAAAHDLVPGWALGLMALAGIALVIWADPLHGDQVDYADQAEEVDA
ncbi:hypothetical protein Q8791_27185 [Nocardiopsis sp. CT-R113]|uniref:Uncharacterized protein n=1 Tax=Nocardiopsis codii TaxID=3065942 RepID=A0ABU7KF83_9ACTN|nr:hypothetical protein [Nocardiopsis sp. CT-R113]MEE2040910.1 hypothetical protein [Nocardiopsis sp. CT-R113]